MGNPENWCKIDVLNLWLPRGEELVYLHTREPLDEGNIPRRPLLVEKTSTYGNKHLGTEWHRVTAGNWLDHSEMLRSMEYEQGTGSA